MAPVAKRRKVGEARIAHGGLRQVRNEMQVEALQEENNDLREQLAALQAPTQVLKYSEADRAGFLKSANKAVGILMLDLSDLQRCSNSFIGDWYPKWKPDKRLDGTVAALIAATNNVQGLDLGEGKWAAEDKYAQELATILRKYSKTLTNVRVAMSTLVDRHETVKSLNQKGRQSRHATVTMSKVNILNVLGGMTKLTTLKLIVNPVGNDGSHCEVGYAGEFNPGLRAKKLFNKLKVLEVYLTKEWAEDHLGNDMDDVVDAHGRDIHDGGDTHDSDTDGSDSDDSNRGYYGNGRMGGGGSRFIRPFKADPCLSDVLTYRADVLTHLDMVPVWKTKTEPPFLAEVAALRKLHSIALRAELLHVTRNMKGLDTVQMHVHGRLSKKIVDSLVELFATLQPLQRLKKLEIVVEQARVGEQVCPLLAAVGKHCCCLEAFRLDGSGWRADDVAALLQGGASDTLRELHLDQCGALQATHLPMVAALTNLATLRLPSRLLGQPGAADLTGKRGLDLRWQH